MKAIKNALAIVVLFCVSLVNAQTPPAVLSGSDIDKFIKTLKPMSEELDALGVELDGVENLSEQLSANAKVMAVLNKYGWDSKMWMKWSSIAMCYAKIKMDEELAALPAEQRAQMKEMMKLAGQSIDSMVNPEDLKLVKAKVSQLDAVMQ